MATSDVKVTPGTGKNVGTYSFTEDAETKDIGRVALNNSSGTEIGNSVTPIQVSLANTATNSTAVKMDGSAVTQPVSAASLPLPSGASTAAKQPALGTAGTAATDVITIQGIASMTKLLVTPDSVALPANQSVNVNQLAGTTTDTNSGNKSAGTLRVVLATDQPALTNKLLVTPDANSSINVAQVAGNTTLAGNGVTGTGSQRVTIASDNTAFSIIAAGVAAQNAAVSGNPLLVGVEARDTLGTVAATGNVVRLAASRYGALLISAFPPSHASSNGTPITSTTTSVISAPAASNHLRVVRIHMSNGGATATWVGVRDGASGTQHYRTYLPQSGVVSIDLNLSGPLDLTSATRLDIVLSAAGSVEYEIDYFTAAD